jgi:hypothetical protein
MIVGQPEFTRRAEHSLAFNAAHPGMLDFEGKGIAARGGRQCRTDQRARYFHADGDIRGAANNVE